MKRVSLLIIALLTPVVLHSSILRISNEDDYAKQLEDNKQIIVEFSADWCSVCNSIKKPFEEIANEPDFQHVAFAQLDVDKFDNISKQNGIVGVPTFIYLENGTKKVEEIGVQNIHAFKDHLRENLNKTFKVAQSDADVSMITDQPTVVAAEETVTVDTETPTESTQENIFSRIFDGIKNFVIVIFQKIYDFFMTIINAIKGFFGR